MKLTKRFTLLIRTVFVACLITLVPINAAETDNQEEDSEVITVTATKRASSIKDVPFSINAQTAGDIKRSGAAGIEDLAGNVAGLMIQNLGPGQSQISIRGVSAGQIVRDQPGVKEQVGIYLDESVISLSLFTPDIDFFDLNRVEVLRGPQGTLFGSGSAGGTIRYITNQPDLDAFEGSFESNINGIDGGGTGGHLKAMLNIPLSEESAALRLVGYRTNYAGFIDALTDDGGINNVNSGSRSGGRISLLFKPREDITITPRIISQKVVMDGNNRQEVYNMLANPYTTERRAVTFDERQQFLVLREGFEDDTLIADLNIEVNFNNFDITSVTSYTERDVFVKRDSTALLGSVGVSPFGFSMDDVMLPAALLDATDVESKTQELRFSSSDDGPLQWIAGIFYSDTQRVYNQSLPVPGWDLAFDTLVGSPGAAAAASLGEGPLGAPFWSELNFDLQQLAIFGEATYDFSEKLHLTFGGRYYDYEETRILTQVGVLSGGVVGQADKTSSDGFTPRFLASYDLDDELTLNAQLSKGFRLGGVNDVLNSGTCSPEDFILFGGFQSYGDETIWNAEAGAKFERGTFSLNVAAFYAKMNDLQVTLDAGSCSSRISFNVPDAHSTGVELELRAQPIDSLRLSVAASLLQSEFDSTVINDNGDVFGGVRDGNRLASTPEFNIGATATYTFPLDSMGINADAFVSSTIQYRSSIYTQPGDQEPGADIFSHFAFAGATGNETTKLDLELDPYQTINMSAGLLFEGWEAVIYINNAADENANLSFDRERGGAARLGFRTNQPRTLGLTIRAAF